MTAEKKITIRYYIRREWFGGSHLQVINIQLSWKPEDKVFLEKMKDIAVKLFDANTATMTVPLEDDITVEWVRLD